MAVHGVFHVLLEELVSETGFVYGPTFRPTAQGVDLIVELAADWETITHSLTIPSEWLDDAPSLEGMKAYFADREDFLRFARNLHSEADEAARDTLVAMAEPVAFEMIRCEKDSNDYVERYTRLGVDLDLL